MPDLAAPIAPRLFTFDADGALLVLGGRDRETGRIVFPLPDDEARYEAILLARRGTLWSWTVQRFRPKSPPYAGPADFVPYAVGYVALGDAIIVEGRLSRVDFERLHIGMAMEVVAEPFELAGGETRLTYAFAPTSELSA